MASQEELAPLRSALARASRDLDAMGVPYALVGGLAVSLRAEPRLTRDVDLAIAVASDAEADGIVHSLLVRGYSVLAALEHVPTGRLATIRLAPPGQQPGMPIVDLLFASSGIEKEVVAEALPLEFAPGLRVPVARISELLAMKILARNDRNRPQDYDDIGHLLSVADEDEVHRARQALLLITERGFHRDKDLLADLESWLRGDGEVDGPFRQRPPR